MSEELRSKFIAFFDGGANADNQRPQLKGEFAVVGGETHTISLWSRAAKETGDTYLRGSIQAKSLKAALKAKAAPASDGAAPAGIDLKTGDVVLFENKTKSENEKRPDYYGYARTASGYVKLAGWVAASNGGEMLRGSAETWTPDGDAARAGATTRAKTTRGKTAEHAR